jgi:ribosomal protein S18 acetylase RimI-like enzyme
VHLAQTLLEPSLNEVHALLAASGFTKLAELLYLQADVRRAGEAPPLPLGYRLDAYDERMHAQFSHVVLTSYEQSLDCPALNGMRHSDDILASHRATGEFDPELWRLLTVHGSAAAVLLLSRIPRTCGMELVYIGLTPEARGKGIGDLLMRMALASAHAHRCEHLSLAVDAANLPALRLYWRHGMQAVGRKLAMCKDLRAAPSK